MGSPTLPPTPTQAQRFALRRRRGDPVAGKTAVGSIRLMVRGNCCWLLAPNELLADSVQAELGPNVKIATARILFSKLGTKIDVLSGGVSIYYNAARIASKKSETEFGVRLAVKHLYVSDRFRVSKRPQRVCCLYFLLCFIPKKNILGLRLGTWAQCGD